MTTYLKVPYEEKDHAKSLGAKWDPARKVWFIPDGKDVSLFAKWMPSLSTSEVHPKDHVDSCLVRIARFIHRAPQVILFENTCWKCKKVVYAVSIVLHIRRSEERKIPGYLFNDISFTYEGDTCFVSDNGGAVANPLVLEQLSAYIEQTPAFRGNVAIFKRNGVNNKYINQCCPHCDAVWKNDALEYRFFEYSEQVLLQRYGRDGLIRAFELKDDKRIKNYLKNLFLSLLSKRLRL
jgi:hypothetical protein